MMAISQNTVNEVHKLLYVQDVILSLKAKCTIIHYAALLNKGTCSIGNGIGIN